MSRLRPIYLDHNATTPLDPRVLDASHYDDSRDPLTDQPVPFIQSAIVSGPYLRLVIPFEPDADGARRGNVNAQLDGLWCRPARVHFH